MIATWSKTMQRELASGPRVLFLPTKQSARPIYSHDNATWKSSIVARFQLQTRPEMFKKEKCSLCVYTDLDHWYVRRQPRCR